MAELNLYQRLLKITEEVGKINKTGRNTQQGYSFIEQAQVVAEVRTQLARYGVMILPEAIERSIEKGQTSKGTAVYHARIKSRYTIVNVDKPEDRFTCEWDAGEALDTSDKATNKATTASHKYFLMKLFNISDKDDPDAHTISTYDPNKHPEELSRQVSGDIKKVTDTSLTKIRQSLSKAGITGEEAAGLMTATIGKIKPETEDEAAQVLIAITEQLEGK